MKLPKFIFKRIMNNNTSLGDNMAFPPEDEYKFEYTIIKKRFNDVCEKLKEFDYSMNLSETEVSNELSKLIKDCKEIEKPISEQLITIAKNAVIDMFEIPKDIININCQLVDKIKIKKTMRIKPQNDSSEFFEFEDLNDFDNLTKVVLKRRLINSLIQGISYIYSLKSKYFLSEIYELNKDLPLLYQKIISLNDYLLFIKEEKITEKKPMQGGYVEVFLGRNNEKSEINVEGIIFPFLYSELIKGLFELFASHGLPDDNKKANYILSQSDFLLAEPWDLRFGVELWKRIDNNFETKYLPYFFQNLCELNVNEFNEDLREIFANTKKGKKIKEEIYDASIQYYNSNQLPIKNKEKNNILNDNYFTADDLNDYIIEENEDSDNKNTNEKEIDLLINCKPEDINFELIERPILRFKGNLPNRGYYDVKISINDIIISHNLVFLRCEEVRINNINTYQLHIEIDEKIRNLGIAYKLHYSFIQVAKTICMLNSNLSANYYKDNNSMIESDNAMPKIYQKLSSQPDITTKTIKNKNGKEIGIILFYNN